MQTVESELAARIKDATSKIDRIKHDYHYEIPVLRLTITLAQHYLSHGHAEAAVLPKVFIVDGLANESVPAPVRVCMEPHKTGRAIQDFWNVWSEAERVARVVTPLP